MRTDRYRFTVWTKEREGGEVVQAELYDHQTDPEETNNLVRESQNGEARCCRRWRRTG